MAAKTRKRKQPKQVQVTQHQTAPQQSTTVDFSNTAVNGNNAITTKTVTKGESKTMAGLTPGQIQALLGATRTKGVYSVYLTDFVNSGEQGVCVNEQWVDLAQKKATTLKQGFENAKDSKNAVAGAENVKVISNEDKVYLINLAAAGIAAPAEPEA